MYWNSSEKRPNISHEAIELSITLPFLINNCQTLKDKLHSINWHGKLLFEFFFKCRIYTLIFLFELIKPDKKIYDFALVTCGFLAYMILATLLFISRKFLNFFVIRKFFFHVDMSFEKYVMVSIFVLSILSNLFLETFIGQFCAVFKFRFSCENS